MSTIRTIYGTTRVLPPPPRRKRKKRGANIHTINGPVQTTLDKYMIPEDRRKLQEEAAMRRANSLLIVGTVGGSRTNPKTSEDRRKLQEEAAMRRNNIVDDESDIIDVKIKTAEERYQEKMKLAEERGEIISLD